MIEKNGIEDKVDLLHGDMREIELTKKADIVVSELLGSFGDNELSPECLFPIQKHIKDTGISIPCFYRSNVAPISTQLLWNDAQLSTESTFTDYLHGKVMDPYSVGYVVNLHNKYFPCTTTENCFEFTHPCEKLIQNQYKNLKFHCRQNAMIHGFAGFFECQLYGDVWFSINPATHTDTMRSWYPIYFPIKSPIIAKKGSEILVKLWRLTKSGKVWYEWAMEFIPTENPEFTFETEIHNINGKDYWIGSTL